MSVKKMSLEAIAKGKLTTVWVRAGGVPDELKYYQGLCEVGSVLCY